MIQGFFEMFSYCFSCVLCCQPDTTLDKHYKEMNTYSEAFVYHERTI